MELQKQGVTSENCSFLGLRRENLIQACQKYTAFSRPFTKETHTHTVPRAFWTKAPASAYCLGSYRGWRWIPGFYSWESPILNRNSKELPSYCLQGAGDFTKSSHRACSHRRTIRCEKTKTKQKTTLKKNHITVFLRQRSITKKIKKWTITLLSR